MTAGAPGPSAGGPTPRPPAVVDLGPDPPALAGGRAVVLGPQGESVLVVRTRRGLFAVTNRCPHRGLPLDDARVTGHTLVCPFHGWRFDLRSGHCRGRNPPAGPLATYRAWRAAGHVFLAAVPRSRKRGWWSSLA
jgi:nitrite reductase/ring-hydroxylating ferredoxin subunit